MNERHNYLAVIGRVVGDDEDTVLLYMNKTRAEAIEAFQEDMTEDLTDQQITDNEHETGAWGGVFVNYVLVSDNPINTDWSAF